MKSRNHSWLRFFILIILDRRISSLKNFLLINRLIISGILPNFVLEFGNSASTETLDYVLLEQIYSPLDQVLRNHHYSLSSRFLIFILSASRIPQTDLVSLQILSHIKSFLCLQLQCTLYKANNIIINFQRKLNLHCGLNS